MGHQTSFRKMADAYVRRVFLMCCLFSAVLSTPYHTSIASALDVTLSWDACTGDIDGYRAFAREEAEDYNYSQPDWEGQSPNCTIYGLFDERDYYFVVRAYNDSGESGDSNEVYYPAGGSEPSGGGGSSGGSGSGGGGCFIATAAFGSPMEPQVFLLRQFRDQYLLSNGPGRAFVHAYYRYSPPLADLIGDHGLARKMVRAGLQPLILLSSILVNFGTIPIIIMFLVVFSALITAITSYMNYMRQAQRFDPTK
ncbi:MAG: fibronectin type III domain-containing protein [Thermodesulfobacteriota bacterium]|nr:fibronectin type III domain-containing protein [Thermodesulfobacteriota bacterium]